MWHLRARIVGKPHNHARTQPPLTPGGWAARPVRPRRPAGAGSWAAQAQLRCSRRRAQAAGADPSRDVRRAPAGADQPTGAALWSALAWPRGAPRQPANGPAGSWRPPHAPRAATHPGLALVGPHRAAGDPTADPARKLMATARGRSRCRRRGQAPRRTPHPDRSSTRAGTTLDQRGRPLPATCESGSSWGRRGG